MIFGGFSVGYSSLPRHRFCAMSGERPCRDIVFAPCRGKAAAPTSFLRHVGRMLLPRHRFRAMSGPLRYLYLMTEKFPDVN